MTVFRNFYLLLLRSLFATSAEHKKRKGKTFNMPY